MCVEYEDVNLDSTELNEINEFCLRFENYFKIFLAKQTVADTINENGKLNEFVIFSEDGLIMKDLDFHSVESLKQRLKETIAKKVASGENSDKYWIYVTMESHVNARELVESLKFFRENNIDYHFTSDDVIEKLIEK